MSTLSHRNLSTALLIFIVSVNPLVPFAVGAHVQTARAFDLVRSAAPPSSVVQSASPAPAQLCLAVPQIKKGPLTPEAFTDLLISSMNGDPNLQITLLGGAGDEAGARQAAAGNGCDYLLLTTIASDEGTSNLNKAGEKIGVMGGGVLGKVLKAEPKFSVAVEYTLEMAATRRQLLSGKVEDRSKDANKATYAVVTKISAAILKQMKETLTQLPPKSEPNTTSAAQTKGVETTTRNFPANQSATQKPRLVVQTAHAGSVTDFAYNHDGTLLATLGNDGTVKLWITASGKELLTISGYRVGGFSFGPDGKTLACLSRNGTIRIFDLATGRVLQRFTGIVTQKKDTEANNLAAMSQLFFTVPLPLVYSFDGRLLVSGGSDGIKVHEVATGRVLRTLDAAPEGQSAGAGGAVTLSPDGKIVAGVTGPQMNEIKLWATESGKEQRIITPGFARVTALEFSQDGLSLVCASSRGSIKVFETKSGRILATPILLPGDKLADASDTAKKGGSLLKKIPGIGGVGGVLGRAGGVIDTVEGVGDLAALMNGSYFKQSIRSLALSHDGKTIAYKAGDDSIKAIRTQDGIAVYSIGGETAGKTDEAQPTSAFLSLCPIKFSPDGLTLNSCSEYKSIKRWDAATGQETYSLGVAKRGAAETSPLANLLIQSSAARFLNDKMLLTSAATGGVKLWDLEKGTAPQELTDQANMGGNIPISADGKLVWRAGADGKSISVRELESNREVRAIATPNRVLGAFFSPDTRLLLVPTFDLNNHGSIAVSLSIFELTSGREVHSLKDVAFFRYEFSPDGGLLAVTTAKNEIKILRTDTWRELSTIKLGTTTNAFFASPMAFSGDGKLLAGVDSTSLKVWDVLSGRVSQQRPLGIDDFIGDLVFRPGEHTLTYTSFSGLYHWNLPSNRLAKATAANDAWGQLSYSPDGKILALGSAENQVRLFDVGQDRELGSLLDPNRDDWMIVTPEGRLDTSRLEDIEEVHWILPSEPFTAQSLEVFMRYYYEPRLLARLLAGEEFAPVPDLTALNRTQPEVKIKSVTPAADGTVDVTVEVANRTSTTQKNTAGGAATSGVYDVRVFRDGQLVGHSTPTERLNLLAQNSGQTGEAQELSAWRQSHQLNLDAQGRATLTFKNIRVPQRAIGSRIVFSAYAFNEDRIKSLSDKYTLAWPAAQQPSRRRAYIIAVGVNAFENSSFNLSFAANDARRMSDVLTRRLQASGQFEEVVPVTLTSDYEQRGAQITVTHSEATKANFKAILDVLSGRTLRPATAQENVLPASLAPVPGKASVTPPRKGSKRVGSVVQVKGKGESSGTVKSPSAITPPALPLAGVRNADKLRAATPDDLVLILYSSHGYADRAGNFYLIPYDTTAGVQKVFTGAVRQHSISSEELSLWLRDVDAGELVLIVDACHSAAAVEGHEFKPGPMGSRGLGQLSYDKGMRILTATQSDNVALENRAIKQGLLTYALTSDGLESLRADYKPQDKTIMLLEWLEYGAARVPKLNEEIMSGQINAAAAGTDTPRLILLNGARGLVDTGPAATPAPGNLATAPAPNVNANNNARTNTARLQQPALFDFARGRSDIILARSQ
jgi:WD40 repeat protein